ncbi:MAG TPA: isoprenylcysteine carboxylmethyltransferase family protein [Devosia sp.]|nr:isoprenylcysteine carboxylmethyltransferase family protein [Devosia sp.]
MRIGTASVERLAPSQLPVALAAVPPRSASSAWVGATGIAAALSSIALLQSWLEPGWMKAVAVLAIVAAAMIATDAATHRLRGVPWGLDAQALRPPNLLRVGQKLVGFWLTIGALAAGYWLLPVYADPAFDAFRDAAFGCLPALVVVAPFYIAYVDRRQPDPDDAFLQLPALLAGARPADWTILRQHVLGWIVKGFFLPLMFGYVTADLAALWSGPLLPRLDGFEPIFNRLIDLFYLLDVLLAAIAYTLTLRLLNSHIRSVEPTVFGWIACLACYPPFNSVTGRFLPYDQDNLFWGGVFAATPVLYVLWGTAILALVSIYMWSTAAFGLRFSNLTHRGIITSGPYRWSRHPAYISKNLSWWLISVPFIAGAGWAQAVQSCLLLAGVNLIYYLRARTEERHLGRDPAYRQYAEFIERRGLFATLARLGAGVLAR